MLELIHKLWDCFASALYPRSCFGCGASGSYWCARCHAQYRPQAYRLENGMTIYAAHPYHHSRIRRALKQLKYHGSSDIANALSLVLATSIPPDGIQNAECVWIPLTASRELERGFNQSELLARGAARHLGIPATDALFKTRETRPQSTLNRAERLKNLRGAFAVANHYKPRPTVIIVDDISTTGATLTEAARVLQKAGATTIIGAVVAHG